MRHFYFEANIDFGFSSRFFILSKQFWQRRTDRLEQTCHQDTRTKVNAPREVQMSNIASRQKLKESNTTDDVETWSIWRKQTRE